MAMPWGSNRLEVELVKRSLARHFQEYSRGGRCILCHKPTCYQGACDDRKERHAEVEKAAETLDHWTQLIGPTRTRHQCFYDTHMEDAPQYGGTISMKEIGTPGRRKIWHGEA
jgi:hypothetical protein